MTSHRRPNGAIAVVAAIVSLSAAACTAPDGDTAVVRAFVVDDGILTIEATPGDDDLTLTEVLTFSDPGKSVGVAAHHQFVLAGPHCGIQPVGATCGGVSKIVLIGRGGHDFYTAITDLPIRTDGFTRR